MPRTREHSEPTRQIYASIREDIYLAAKARATELRLPMRRFIEEALANAISADNSTTTDLTDSQFSPDQRRPSIWDDQYLEAQARQPLGAPLNLSEYEARRVALGAFEDSAEFEDQPFPSVPDRIQSHVMGYVGDPVELSDEDAAQIAREVLLFGPRGSKEGGDG